VTKKNYQQTKQKKLIHELHVLTRKKLKRSAEQLVSIKKLVLISAIRGQKLSGQKTVDKKTIL
jgi:hypothetical protein